MADFQITVDKYTKELKEDKIVERHLDLREHFQTQIKQLYNQLGETQYTEIMRNVDVETMKNMQEFVTV